ncbi:MAG: hypothetical protein RML72_09250 [Bacteroidia bacterium]|nr:insulinase family protein [Bacteroidia bacterium]MDW8159043.1 hypothetical protein [Bacteroidia bacterium]
MHKPTKDPVVALAIIFPILPENLNSSLQGVESLVLQTIIQGGSLGLSKKQFQAQLQAHGIQLTTQVYADYVTIQMLCLKKHFAYARDLLFEALVEPAFEIGNYLQIRQRQALKQKQVLEEPKEKFLWQAQKYFFKEHPYSFSPLGTYENLVTITRDSAFAFYRKVIQKYRLKVAIIGDISIDSLATYLRNLPIGGETLAAHPSAPNFHSLKSHIEIDKSISASYIEGRFLAPSPQERNSIVLQIALIVALEKLKKELCLRKNLTCDINLWYNPCAASHTIVSYVAKHPEPTIFAFNRILKELIDRGFSIEEIENAKIKLIMGYYLKLQSKENQIEELARQLQHKNWELMQNFPEIVKAITPEEALKIFRQYLRNGSWYVIAHSDKITKDILGRY